MLVVAHEQAGQRDLSMPAVRENITATLRSRKEQLMRAAYLTAAQNQRRRSSLPGTAAGRVAGEDTEFGTRGAR